jgi:hypothetical protein
MIKKLILIASIATLASTMTLNAQKITGVKYSLFEKTANDYWLRVTPNMFDGYASETTETSGV